MRSTLPNTSSNPGTEQLLRRSSDGKRRSRSALVPLLGVGVFGMILYIGWSSRQHHPDSKYLTAPNLIGTYPKIIHHMHANLSALNPVQKALMDKCQELHPDWQFFFWDDDKVKRFIQTQYGWFYPVWDKLDAFIKKLDTSRYMLMHHFGKSPSHHTTHFCLFACPPASDAYLLPVTIPSDTGNGLRYSGGVRSIWRCNSTLFDGPCLNLYRYVLGT